MPQQLLKPIETKYNGYRFRSRLEARWAVFFDTLDVPYRYEPEGFDLDGTWYLPDFWLPTWECWVEIKPHSPCYDEMNRCCALAGKSGFPCIVLYGDVWPKQHGFMCFRREGPRLVTLENWEESYFASCAHCEGVYYLAPGEWDGDDGEYAIGPHTCGVESGIWLSNGIRPRTITDGDDPCVERAYEVARSARFEHGERGGH